MLDILATQIIKGLLIVTSAVFFAVAQYAESYQYYPDPFGEAAKYGFAVLFLMIVLFMLFKEYKEGKGDNKNLNKLITGMAEENRKALEQSTQAITAMNEILKRIEDRVYGNRE